MGLDVDITPLRTFFFFISAAVTMGSMRLRLSALSKGMVDSGQTTALHYHKVTFLLE